MRQFFGQFIGLRTGIVTLVAVVAIHALLAFASFSPTTRSEMSDLPVGIVDLDNGVVAEQFFAADHELLDWKAFSDRATLEKAMLDKELYAGLIIPDGADEMLGEGSTAGAPVELDVVINEGANASAAAASADVINGMAQQIGQSIAESRVADLESAGSVVEPADVRALSTPLTVSQSVVNPAGGQEGSQVPLMLVVLAWIGTLVASLVIWLSLHRSGQTANGFVSSQLVSGGILSVVQPLSIFLLARGIAGIDLSFSAQLYIALVLASLAFFMLQSTVLNWLGFGGWPILVMIWLFSFGMLSMPPEALSAFYRDGIYSWIPIRFPFEAIQGVLFFDGEGVTSRMLWVTAGIALGAAAAVLASIPVLNRRDLTISPMRARLNRLESTSPEPVEGRYAEA